ncbi:hypothetical protein CAEBREN_19733 [Caenorhabditis brenneri]|uniref:GDP-Man:Man(3)GlcNAc(2)-PP-Dol alpha-1,2-mannosyltransferase n=1 Tax=Caenorhabditis brenneri TaxID=135651 RepID=G0NGS6_CAEBE|nr:hypothetical protein CAEBREN_19733 [Caenorhabditis brenneri]
MERQSVVEQILSYTGYVVPTILALILIPFKLFSDYKRQSNTVGFFHPYCNAGGGGERVLWAAIRIMQKKFPEFTYYVYSGDTDATKEQILLKARQRFGIELDPTNIEFVYLKWRTLVEARHYPRLTMIFQALGGLVLALEAWYRLVPDLFIDSMGYPLALPAFRLAGSRVITYVHYPTISVDMLSLVESRQESFNNSSTIAQSNILSWLKLWYYHFFAFIYWIAGLAAQVVMVNGSWTQRHINYMWKRRDVRIVYPPCDVEAFLNIESVAESLLEDTKTVRLLSVGQIRPEKNHMLQLEVLHDVKEPLEKKGYKVELCIAGGCRNEEDQERVRMLKAEAEKMGITEQLKWQLNVPYEDLVAELSKALISIHTMHNEHFGISVVEAMAASTIILSNDSGGPKMDIVKNFEQHCVGYLSVTRDEYVETILKIVEEGREKRDEIRKYARKSLTRFGEAAFDRLWINEIGRVF